MRTPWEKQPGQRSTDGRKGRVFTMRLEDKDRERFQKCAELYDLRKKEQRRAAAEAEGEEYWASYSKAPTLGEFLRLAALQLCESLEVPTPTPPAPKKKKPTPSTRTSSKKTPAKKTSSTRTSSKKPAPSKKKTARLLTPDDELLARIWPKSSVMQRRHLAKSAKGAKLFAEARARRDGRAGVVGRGPLKRKKATPATRSSSKSSSSPSSSSSASRSSSRSSSSTRSSSSGMTPIIKKAIKLGIAESNGTVSPEKYPAFEQLLRDEAPRTAIEELPVYERASCVNCREPRMYREDVPHAERHDKHCFPKGWTLTPSSSSTSGITGELEEAPSAVFEQLVEQGIAEGVAATKPTRARRARLGHDPFKRRGGGAS